MYCTVVAGYVYCTYCSGLVCVLYCSDRVCVQYCTLAPNTCIPLMREHRDNSISKFSKCLVFDISGSQYLNSSIFALYEFCTIRYLNFSSFIHIAVYFFCLIFTLSSFLVFYIYTALLSIFILLILMYTIRYFCCCILYLYNLIFIYNLF